MTDTLYYIICGLLSLLALAGISMMSKVKTATRGNLILSLSLLAGFITTLLHYKIVEVTTIYVFILVGCVIGAYIARKVQMMQMPQTVAMLNGLGGLAGAIVGGLTYIGIGVDEVIKYPLFVNVTAVVAVIVGMVTFVGSMVAAGKLHRLLSQKPVIWKNHEAILLLTIIGSLTAIALSFFTGRGFGVLADPYFILTLAILSGSLFGLAFSIRVGGADMPITISLLTSLAGVAAAIAGLAIGDLLVVSIGGIVGSSGLILTQIMCRAMNRNLMVILTGKTSVASGNVVKVTGDSAATPPEESKPCDYSTLLNNAKRAIIVPGYGMALAQAQHLVRQLADKLEAQGTDVKYAIHPVAGRMPGHMNVLLAEADVPYDKLYEMDAVNDDFKDTDIVIVIGANDVLNPAARDAVDTPIYGMPVLNVDQAKHIIICNYDLSPGYAGVPNPLYEMKDKVTLLLGDAKESLTTLIYKDEQSGLSTEEETNTDSPLNDTASLLKNAKRAIIVPGYGMALAQAQHLVRQLADKLEAQGTDVKYAIHPVAGRMPGHMNVLLAEADVPYDKLYEMDAVNDDFKDTDIVIVIGANDVLNPAARDAVDTPIYGMPVLNVDQAKHIIICNYDLNPGYAGVPNPLYEMKDKVTLLLGDAKESLTTLIS
ncbi:NAD(P)(+) transhydrogenase (Re/Si-specific) subunit beta [Massilibacteroides vaginae]|uniref:NAD(P)(+) transhydrogenase (Re/Si-specific) subunit beta n=1 Tax=Massilibacteroides vaginae TaxID=1673718 RepID=UPI000A1C7CB4|nr:NAD(P)(+) transhydrogenase (Re/Si-specific) subunit beta [Massilibacteroides vaginae]